MNEDFNFLEYYRNNAGMIPDEVIMANTFKSANEGANVVMPDYETAKKTYKEMYGDKFKESGFNEFYNKGKQAYQKYDKLEYSAENSSLPVYASIFRQMYYGQKDFDITGTSSNQRKALGDLGIDLNADLSSAVYGDDFETPYQTMIKSKDASKIENSKYTKLMDYTKKAQDVAEASGVTYLYDKNTDDVKYDAEGNPVFKQNNPEDLDFSFSGIFGKTGDKSWALRFDKNTGKPLMVEIDDTADQYKVTDRKSIWSESSMSSDIWGLPVTASRIIPNVLGNIAKNTAYAIDTLSGETFDNTLEKPSAVSEWLYRWGSNLSANKNLDQQGSAFHNTESFIAAVGQGVESYLPIVALSLTGAGAWALGYGGLEAARFGFEDARQSGMTEREASLHGLYLGAVAMASGKLLEGKWLNSLGLKAPKAVKKVFAEEIRKMSQEAIKEMGEKGIDFSNKFAVEKATAEILKGKLSGSINNVFNKLNGFKNTILEKRKEMLDKLSKNWVGATVNQTINEGLEEELEYINEESIKAFEREYVLSNKIYGGDTSSNLTMTFTVDEDEKLSSITEPTKLEKTKNWLTEQTGIDWNTPNKREDRFVQSLANKTNSFSEKKWEDLLLGAAETFVIGGVVGGITSVVPNFLNRKELEKEIKTDLILTNVLDGKKEELLSDANDELELIKLGKSSLGSNKLDSQGNPIDLSQNEAYKKTEAYYNWKLTKDRIDVIDNFVKALKIDDKIKDPKLRPAVEKKLSEFLNGTELQKDSYKAFIQVYNKQKELDDLTKPDENNVLNQEQIDFEDKIKKVRDEAFADLGLPLPSKLKNQQTQQEYLEEIFTKTTNNEVEKQVEKSIYRNLYQIENEIIELQHQINQLDNENYDKYEALQEQLTVLNDSKKKFQEKINLPTVIQSNPKIEAIKNKLLEIKSAKLLSDKAITDDLYKENIQTGFLNSLKEKLTNLAASTEPIDDKAYLQGKLDWLDKFVFSNGKANIDAVNKLNRERKLNIAKSLRDVVQTNDLNKQAAEENTQKLEEYLDSVDTTLSDIDEQVDRVGFLLSRDEAVLNGDAVYENDTEKKESSLFDYKKLNDGINQLKQNLDLLSKKSILKEPDKKKIEVIETLLNKVNELSMIQSNVDIKQKLDKDNLESYVAPTFTLFTPVDTEEFVKNLDFNISTGKLENGIIELNGVTNEINKLKKLKDASKDDPSAFISAATGSIKTLYDNVFRNEVLADLNYLVNNPFIDIAENDKRVNYIKGDLSRLDVETFRRIQVEIATQKGTLKDLFKFLQDNANNRYIKDDNIRLQYIKDEIKLLQDFVDNDYYVEDIKFEKLFEKSDASVKARVESFKAKLNEYTKDKLDNLKFTVDANEEYINLLKLQKEFVSLFNNGTNGLDIDNVNRFVKNYIISQTIRQYSNYNPQSGSHSHIDQNSIFHNISNENLGVVESKETIYIAITTNTKLTGYKGEKNNYSDKKVGTSQPYLIDVNRTLLTMQQSILPSLLNMFGTNAVEFYDRAVEDAKNKDLIPSLEQEIANRTIYNFLSTDNSIFSSVLDLANEHRKLAHGDKLDYFNNLENIIFVEGSGGSGKTKMVIKSSLNLIKGKKILYTAPFTQQVENLSKELGSISNSEKVNSVEDLLKRDFEKDGIDILVIDEGTVVSNTVLQELNKKITIENNRRKTTKQDKLKMIVLGDTTQLVGSQNNANLSSSQMYSSVGYSENGILKMSTKVLSQKFRNNYVIFDDFDTYYENIIKAESTNVGDYYKDSMWFDDGNILNRHGIKYQSLNSSIDEFIVHYNAIQEWNKNPLNTPKTIAYITFDKDKNSADVALIRKKLTDVKIPVDKVLLDAYSAQGSEFDVVYGHIVSSGSSEDVKTANRATRVIGSRRKNYLSLTTTNVDKPSNKTALMKYEDESLDRIKERTKKKVELMDKIVKDKELQPEATSADKAAETEQTEGNPTNSETTQETLASLTTSVKKEEIITNESKKNVRKNLISNLTSC